MNNPYIHDPKTPTKFYPPRAIPENEMKHEEMRMQYLRKPAGHPHAELMAQYEQDVEDHGEQAYTLWEYKANASIEWRPCVLTPEWAEHCQYRRKQQGHKHAQLMAQYAQDAMTHERPWELWQVKPKGAEIWHPLQFPARWYEDQDYRRKPEPVAQDFLVFCEISVRALSAAEAAWTFRELVASGVAQVGVQERVGEQFHDHVGVRPKEK